MMEQDGQGTYKVRWCNHCCSGKVTSITQSECVYAAVCIENAMHMRHIVICGLSLSTIFLPHFLINGTISEEKLLNTKCVFWFFLQPLYETFLILRRNERDMIKNEQDMMKNVYWSPCKVPLLFLSDFNKTWIFFTYFRKILKYKI